MFFTAFSVGEVCRDSFNISDSEDVLPYELSVRISQSADQTFQKEFPLYEGQVFANGETVIGPTHSANPLQWTHIGTQDKRRSFIQAYLKGQFAGDERYIVLKNIRGRNQLLAKVVLVLEDGIVVDYLTGRGTLEKRKIPEKYLSKTEISSVSQRAFDRVHQAENTLDFIPIEPTYKKEELKRQGYRNIFIDGVDTAYWIRDFVRELRKASVNPYKTHIENFVEFIDKHVHFVKQGIIRQGVDLEERLELLKGLELEAARRVKNQKVTYHWWLYWNHRLAIAATPLKKRQPSSNDFGWQTEENWLKMLESTFTLNRSSSGIVAYLQNVIDQFPEKILFPVQGHLGVRAFNILVDSHIWPQGLNNRMVFVDGLTMQSDLYSTNDIEHSFLSWGGGLKVYDSLMSFSADLPAAEQEKIDMVYFISALERSEVADIFNDGKNSSVLYSHESRFLRKNNLGWLIPLNIDLKRKNDVHQYLASSMKAFRRAVQLYKDSKSLKFMDF